MPSFISPFNRKSKKFTKGATGAISELTKKVKGFNKRPIWFHCASLGEFEQAKPLIELIRETSPSTPTVVTFFSPSGYENAGDYAGVDAICYLPRDTIKNAEKFINVMNPVAAIFIRYEFWYYLMKKMLDSRIPVFSVSADFRQSQIFFKRSGSFYLKLLKRLTHIFVQNEQSLNLLGKYGVHNATVLGDSRYDRVCKIVSQGERVTAVEDWIGESKVIIVGSAWSADMGIIYPLINSKTDYKYIIAPHELNQKFYEEMERNIESDITYYSTGAEDSRVLILDTIGMLARMYTYSTFAYVGGGMGSGVHSVVEPAGFGQPIFYGNRNYQRWSEAVELEKAGAGFPVSSSEEIISLITRFEEDPEYYRTTSDIAKTFVSEKAGSSKEVLSYIRDML
jgi:3-deoxy-D-manno-octulosonic-acid transferase